MTAAPAVLVPAPHEPAMSEQTLQPRITPPIILTAYHDVITPCIRGRVVA